MNYYDVLEVEHEYLQLLVTIPAIVFWSGRETLRLSARHSLLLFPPSSAARRITVIEMLGSFIST